MLYFKVKLMLKSLSYTLKAEVMLKKFKVILKSFK